MSGGRSITIDIYAVDGNGKVYDVEAIHVYDMGTIAKICTSLLNDPIDMIQCN